jgi:hypothetical protein
VLGSRQKGRRAPAHARRTRTDRPRGSELRESAILTDERSALSDERSALSDERSALSDERSAPEDVGDDLVMRRADAPLPASRTSRPSRTGRTLLRDVRRRERTLTAGGAHLRVLVLASTREDTAVIDLASGSLLRLRIPWPAAHEPDLSPFDVVEATLADDPERDDLAQPEAATVREPPRHVGALKGRRVRAMLARLEAKPHGPLLGFHGPSAPYWDFHGLRPSLALVHPTRGPQLMRRHADGSTWVRFGWERDDVWLPVEDSRAVRALDASRRDRLTGKPLATALGFSPHYLLTGVSSPRAGHCYKSCLAILPKG